MKTANKILETFFGFGMVVMILVSAPARADDYSYWIVGNDTETNYVTFENDGSWSGWKECSLVNREDSVMSKLILWEVDKGDFDKGRIHCRHMASDGTLGSSHAYSSYFFDKSSSDSDTSETSVTIPDDSLPVGIITKDDGNALIDYEMAYLTQEQIFSGRDPSDSWVNTGYTGFALGYSGAIHYENLYCSPGYVIDGFNVRYEGNGSSKAKIRAIAIQCRMLDRE